VNLTGIYKFSPPETASDGMPVFFNPAVVIANPVADIQAVERRWAAAAVACKYPVPDAATGCKMRKLIKGQPVCISIYQIISTLISD
jgi:hypothetical protein